MSQYFSFNSLPALLKSFYMTNQMAVFWQDFGKILKASIFPHVMWCRTAHLFVMMMMFLERGNVHNLLGLDCSAPCSAKFALCASTLTLGVRIAFATLGTLGTLGSHIKPVCHTSIQYPTSLPCNLICHFVAGTLPCDEHPPYQQYPCCLCTFFIAVFCACAVLGESVEKCGKVGR